MKEGGKKRQVSLKQKVTNESQPTRQYCIYLTCVCLKKIISSPCDNLKKKFFK